MKQSCFFAACTYARKRLDSRSTLASNTLRYYAICHEQRPVGVNQAQANTID
jgi:hypothetical protein